MKRNYFFVASVLILILALIAFSDNLITDVGQPSNRDPKFIIHGLFCFLFVSVLVTQSWLIRRRNIRTHKKLGIFGMAIAIGVVASTGYIYFLKFESWNETFFLTKANMIFIASYAVLVVLAYINRKSSELHKHFIFLATLYMLGPILDRVGGNTGITPYLTNPVIWNGMFLSFFVYDWKTIGKIHPITYLGYAWFWAVWAIAILT